MQYKKVTYPDGTFYPQISEFSNKLTFRINSYEDLWFLKQIKDILDHNKQEVDLTIPCLLDAQADNRFNENESFNLKLICEFIRDMNWKSVSIFHPHNQEFVKAIIDDVIILDNKSFIQDCITLLISSNYGKNYNILDADTWQNNTIIMSPDAGAYKWVTKLADKINFKGEVLSASKSRKWEDNKSVLFQEVLQQDLKGKDILLIDDLLIGGGSMIGLAKILKQRNCGKLYCAVSHITVPSPNTELFDLFDKVFTTNSKGLNYTKPITSEFETKNTPINLRVINLFKI